MIRYGILAYSHLADPNKAQPVPEDMTDNVAEYKNQIAEDCHE